MPPVAVPVVPQRNGEEEIPVAEVISSPFDAAAKFLDQALKASPQDGQIAYLLALAYKRQGKPADARQALRKINRPDANVFLQMGLLSLQEDQSAQAEQEFARAWQMDPTCYAACYNLLMTRLTLDRLDDCAALIPEALKLVPTEDERSFLSLLQLLLRHCRNRGTSDRLDPALLEMSDEEEQRLLQMIQGLGQVSTAFTLLHALASTRLNSMAVQEAYQEVALVQARLLLDRCHWAEAEPLLAPLARDRYGPRAIQAAMLNLLGCCSCLNQDFNSGVRHFNAALKHSPNDARIHQNAALAYELQGDLAGADPHWNRFFDLVDRRISAPPGEPDYHEQLLFDSLNRLAGLYTEKEKWQTALGYVQRAQRLEPDDIDMLERLFHAYASAKRPDDARRTLRRLRDLRPREPQYDLYEIDLIEPKSLSDIEKMLGGIVDIVERYPNDPRVEERAIRMVGNVIPLMSRLCDQLTEQLSKIIDQVRHLPNYQINWHAVHDAMRDLIREFRKLRRITNKCLPLVKNDDHRRIIRDLSEHIDRKIEACQSMGG